MSDTNNRPTGDIRGDDKAIPDMGARTGVTDDYGANLEQGFNAEGNIKSSTGSDGMQEGGYSKNKR